MLRHGHTGPWQVSRRSRSLRVPEGFLSLVACGLGGVEFDPNTRRVHASGRYGGRAALQPACGDRGEGCVHGTTLFPSDACARHIAPAPSAACCPIGDDGVEIAPLPSRPVPSSYEDGLSHFIETWVRRFETLLSDRRVGVVVDVTGGRDSRTVYALCRAAERRARPASCALLLRPGRRGFPAGGCALPLLRRPS